MQAPVRGYEPKPQTAPGGAAAQNQAAKPGSKTNLRGMSYEEGAKALAPGEGAPSGRGAAASPALAGAAKEASPAKDASASKQAPPQLEPGSGGGSGVMEKEAARSLLQSAFGTYKTMSAGNVQVLPQADFQVAYDGIYGTGPYAWATYVVPRFGNLNGFAYNGVNYINRDAADVTTTPHEMLHNNVASDWRPVVGSPFDEGSTEYLEQYALRTGNIANSAMSHYPNERAVVDKFIASGQSEANLFTAYLQGGADTLVKGHVDANCKKTWAEVKTATEQSKWAEAKAGLEKK